MCKRPRVLLLIPHLEGGGAERVTALLARELSTRKYDVHLGVVTGSAGVPETGQETCAGRLPDSLRTHWLGAQRVRSSAPALLRLVRRLEPDLILSGMAHLNFLVLLLRPLLPRKTRIVVRQNSTVSSDLSSGRLPVYTPCLYRLLYPSADRIVCQTSAMAADLAVQARIDKARLKVLPNPVDVEAIRAVSGAANSPWRGPGPHLLAVGRLSREKGFDLLLEAFASLRLKLTQADLTIAGTGPEEAALRALRDELCLGESVHFAGYVARPECLFPGASLFVLPSRHEGLPNALLEAGAGGLPIVAAPASKGIASLLHGCCGAWVAAEASSAALTVSLLAALRELRPEERFAHTWVDTFGLERAIRCYEQLIDETLQELRP